MRPRIVGVLAVAAGSVVAFLAVVRSRALPLGVPGEWEWLRPQSGPEPFALGLAVLAVFGYAFFIAIGARALTVRRGGVLEAIWASALLPAAVGIQLAVQFGAPPGYGLEKWVFALHQKGSSGYFTVAKEEAADLPRFLDSYPTWIQKQDALHIGTHPPGLIASQAWLLQFMERSPGLTRSVLSAAPGAVTMAFRAYDRDGRIGPADRATLATTGALTLLACSLTVIPLYALARSSLSPTAAWATAAVWPVVPSAVLFQPSADTAFPLVSTLALTLAVQAVHRRALSSTILATACGATLGVGMQFSLVFLAAGLIVAVLSAAAAGTPVRRRVEVLAFTGVGFLAVTVLWWWYTGANPFEVWWFNQKNHSRFYVEYPRTFWVWALVNPVELAAGLGLPAAVWALMGLSRPRLVPVPALAAVLVLAILTLTGRNLSEVARLWLPFMPALLAALGAGLERLDAKAPAVGATVALVGLQTLFLQTLVQVVYPV